MNYFVLLKNVSEEELDHTITKAGLELRRKILFCEEKKFHNNF